MKKVFIIYTGGTIGMVQNAEGILMPMDFGHITSHLPELERLSFEINTYSFTPVIDSSEMQPSTWAAIATLIADNYADYDGFVVLHGSDTMAYTASALSFMLQNINKPVVLTGSQLPIGEIRTDAKENLITALQIAAEGVVNEVCIYFDYFLLRGNRAKKVHASKFEAFRTPNYPILAEAEVHLKYNEQNILPKNKEALSLNTLMESHIGVLKLYPGIDASTVRAIVLNADTKAIIIEAFGTGNTCTQSWFVDLLKDAAGMGKILIDISQCIGGKVELGRYATSSHLVDLEILSGADMTFECAITKIMYLLGNYSDKDKIKYHFERNICGEVSI